MKELALPASAVIKGRLSALTTPSRKENVNQKCNIKATLKLKATTRQVHSGGLGGQSLAKSDHWAGYPKWKQKHGGHETVTNSKLLCMVANEQQQFEKFKCPSGHERPYFLVLPSATSTK